MRTWLSRIVPTQITVGALVATLAACGEQNAVTAMSALAVRMCECKDAACADKVFLEVEQLAAASAGKEVGASAAEKYDAEMDRAQMCYERQKR